MPSQSSNATTLRKPGHAIRGWLSIFKGVSVCNANVTSIPTVYPFTTLGISITSGAIGSVERGAEIIVTDSTNNYKGRLRVRYSGTLNSTNLPIAEVSKATMEIVVGDKVQILSEHRLHPKFPEASVTFDPDMVDYVDQNTVLPPIANSGGPVAAWVDTGQSYATLSFDGSSAYTVDSGSSGTITHAWTFPSGSTPASSTSASPTGVQIPVGEWWVKHTVTDSSNSKTWTQYIPVRVHNTANPPYEVNISSFDSDLTEGWRATFEMLEAVSLTNAPDGAPVIFWLEEVMDGTVQSFGNRVAARSNIKFFGYLRSDNSQSEIHHNQLTLNAVSPLRVLAEMNGFSKVFIDDAAANDWTELQTLSVKRAILQILRWYTTFAECHDITFDFTDFTYPRFYLQKNTPLEQLKELADGVDSRVVVDRTGCLQIQKDPALTKLSDRSGLVTTYTLSGDDVISFQMQREHYRPVDLLECRGIGNTAELPYFSRYPGKAPGEGNQNVVQDRLIVSNQTDLNVRCGLRGAKLDRVYITNASRFHYAPSGTVVLFGSYDVFDFYREWVAFSLTGTSNWREVDLSAFRWMIQSVTVTYEQGTATTTLNLQAETAGQAGTTHIPPAPPDNQLPDYDLDDPIFVPPVSNDPISMRPTDKIVCVTDTGHLVYTTNFTNASPTWTDVDITGSLTSAIVLSFAVDATSPAYLGTGTSVNGWIVTVAEVAYIEDMFSATPTVTVQHTFPNLIASGSAGYAGSIDADFTNSPGNFLVVCYSTVDATTWLRSIISTDGGSTWSSENKIVNFHVARLMCVAIDPHNAGSAYVFTGISETLWRMTNYNNDLWEELPQFDGVSETQPGLSLFFPYGVNPTRYLYWIGPGSHKLYRSDLLTDSEITIPVDYPTGSARPRGQPTRRGAISIPSGKPTRMMLIIDDASNNRGILLTDEANSEDPTWTIILSLQNTNLWAGCALTDPDGAAAYLWGTGKIGWWDGSTIAVKNGTGFTTALVLAIAGG